MRTPVDIATDGQVVDLLDVRQREVAGSKLDLPDELAALGLMPGVRDVVDIMTSPTVDVDALEDLAAAFDGHVRTDGSLTEVVLRVTSAQPWPDALAGPADSSERGRILTLTARHAGWRDRRVRRLTGVRVQAVPASTGPVVVDMQRARQRAAAPA